MIDVLQTLWPTLALLGGMAALFLLLLRGPGARRRLRHLVGRGKPAVVKLYREA